MQDIKEIQLTAGEMEKVYEVKRNGAYMGTDFIAELYKYRYKLKMAPTDIALRMGKSKRTIQYHLKNFGWEYDIFEAQKMAACKRDYADIMTKNKMRYLENAFTSEPENYVRHKIGHLLNKAIQNAEVIVGINDRYILSGKEIDIPIIIIRGQIVYKIAIELNGDYWHENKTKSDKAKMHQLIERGYMYYAIKQNGNTKVQREISGNLDAQMEIIVLDIKNKINIE